MHICKIVFSLGLLSSSCFANISDFAFSSKSASMGSVSVSDSDNSGFASFNNPALISENIFSFESKYIKTNFDKIDSIITENRSTTSTFNNTNPDKYASVDTNYQDTFAAIIGVNKNIFSNINLGFSGYLPLPRIIYLDAVDPIMPSYSDYRSNFLRPYLNFGFAFSKFDFFKIGASLNTTFNATAANSASIIDSTNTISRQRFVASIKPSFSPSFGIYLKPYDLLQFGSVVKLPMKNKMYIDVNANYASAIPSIPMVFSGDSTLYYDPLEVKFGITSNSLSFLKQSFEYSFYRTSKYEFQDIKLNFTAPNVANSEITPVPTKNSHSFHFGNEIMIENYIVRLGFMYKSAFIDLQKLPLNRNFIDADKYIYTAGLGYKFNNIELLSHLQYHKLKEQNIAKQNTSEIGYTPGGYRVGGNIISAGFGAEFTY